MDEPVQEDFDQGWRTNVRDEYNEWTTVRRNRGKGRLAGGEPGEGGGRKSPLPRGSSTRDPTPAPSGNRGCSRGPRRSLTRERGQRTLQEYRFSSHPRPPSSQPPPGSQPYTQAYPTTQMAPYPAGMPQPVMQYISQPTSMIPPQHTTQYIQPPPPSQIRYPPTVSITPATPGRWSEEPMRLGNEEQTQHFGSEGWN
ncbi:hypothetical protein GGU11DRAFT_748038 [Lentinula aff. detonsa]|nr:hypothetical protein GGU11DRAFT_748038 [Lentinula aff. detonsa]